MRFALIGDHPDGLDMARALADSGRHQLVIFCGPALAFDLLSRWSLSPRRIGDMEAVLADPSVEGVIVAGRIGDRPNQLRRALQSELHVLCLHPADQTADIAYEAEMIRKDTGKRLVPLLPEALHPAIARLASLLRAHVDARGLLVEIERHAREQVLLEADDVNDRPGFPCWDILRALGGDIIELMAFAETEHAAVDEPILLCGRFVNGGLFQEKLLPNQPEALLNVTVRCQEQRFELRFPHGVTATSQLVWTDAGGEPHQENWEAWNPWPALVAAFEKKPRTGERVQQPGELDQHVTTDDVHLRAIVPPSTERGPELSWQDEIRALELDVAARRSMEHRRAGTLDFEEVTEEASFKGAMTLVGCGLLWSSLMLLILSVWLPWLGWLILPLFAVFLLLQALRLGMPKQPAASADNPPGSADQDAAPENNP